MKATNRFILLAAATLAVLIAAAFLLPVSINPEEPVSGRTTGTEGTTTALSAATSNPSIAVSVASLLPNPGFENGLTGWIDGTSSPTEAYPNQGYSVDVDRTVMHSGTASARIQPTADPGETPATLGYVSAKVPADTLRGKRVRYSAYVRTKDESGAGAGLYMDVMGSIGGRPIDPGLPLSWDSMIPKRQVLETTDWQKYSIVLDVPPEADYLVFGLEVGSYGQAWIDDVQLEIVGSDVPSTDQAGKKELDNLDFEQGLDNWDKDLPATGQTDVGTGLEMAHAGKLGAFLRHSGGGSHLFGSLIYANLYGGYYQGKKVRAAAYINIDKAPSGATFFLTADYLSTDNQLMPPISAKTEVTPGKAGWQRVEVLLDIPYRARFINFGIRLDGDGEVWIDDVQFDIVNSNTPVDTSTRTPAGTTVPTKAPTAVSGTSTRPQGEILHAYKKAD